MIFCKIPRKPPNGKSVFIKVTGFKHAKKDSVTGGFEIYII